MTADADSKRACPSESGRQRLLRQVPEKSDVPHLGPRRDISRVRRPRDRRVGTEISQHRRDRDLQQEQSPFLP